jgi:hypothetical protein
MLRFPIGQLLPTIYFHNSISRPANYVLPSAPIVSKIQYPLQPITYSNFNPIIANSNFNFQSMPTQFYAPLPPTPISHPTYISTAPTVVFHGLNSYPHLNPIPVVNNYHHPLSSISNIQNLSLSNYCYSKSLFSQAPKTATQFTNNNSRNFNSTNQSPISINSIATQTAKKTTSDSATQTDNFYDPNSTKGLKRHQTPFPSIYGALRRTNDMAEFIKAVDDAEDFLLENRRAYPSNGEIKSPSGSVLRNLTQQERYC